MTIIDPRAVEKLQAAIDAGRLKSGSWGGTETVCMMSAMVTGSDSTGACVTAGWPEWLAYLNVSLFDAEVGANDEGKARNDFALAVAMAATKPVNYDKARDLFLIRRLETGEYSALKSLRLNPVDAYWWQDCKAVILRVAELLRRRIAGDDVADELVAANAAANATAYAAYTTTAARAAAFAAADAAAATAANATARAAARADLIAALNEATHA